jgi:hypothetical protein
MQTVVTAEHVMAYWNDVMKHAGSCEKNNNKRERENYRSVMPLQPKIKSCHKLTPQHILTLPWLRRN